MSERVFLYPVQLPNGEIQDHYIPESKLQREHIEYYIDFFSGMFDKGCPELAKPAVFKNVCSIMVQFNTRKDERARVIEEQANTQMQEVMIAMGKIKESKA